MYYGRKAMPVSSKYLAQQEWKENQDLLKKRVQNARPGIDNRAPKEFPHLYQNGKKEQLLEDRYAQIEHDNRILLNKMSDILTRKPSHLPQNNGGAAPAWMYAHSLNRDSRRKELKRITEENFKLLKRIQGVHASFDRKKLEKDRERQEKLILNMTEYHKMPIQGPKSPVKDQTVKNQGSTLNNNGAGSPTNAGKASKEGSMISFSSGSVGQPPLMLGDQPYNNNMYGNNALANTGSGIIGNAGGFGGYNMYSNAPGTAGSMASYSSGGVGYLNYNNNNNNNNGNNMQYSNNPGTAGGSYPTTPGGYGLGLAGNTFSSNLGASFAAPGTRGQLASAGSIGSYGGPSPAGMHTMGMGTIGLNPSSGGSYLAGAGRFGIGLGGSLGGGLSAGNSATTPGAANSNMFNSNRPSTFGA